MAGINVKGVRTIFACLTMAILPPAGADTTQTPSPTLTIRNQTFMPATLAIPANRAVTIQVTNQDQLPAEFESYDLKREKVIPGRSRVPVFVGPLKPGVYGFFNDFHPASTGRLVVGRPKHQEAR